MLPADSAENTQAPAENPFAAADIEAILRERRWLAGDWQSAAGEQQAAVQSWLERAAALLGPHATDVDALAGLLSLVFQYDAQAILAALEAHTVLAREGAREVIRDLAHAVLEGAEVDSDRFKEIVTALKEKTGRRGRELFHPLRLALAGRAGEGELDRVILLLDAAAKLPLAVAVKTVRERMLEFCAALD
jgi:glutamyl/glutaminyl-tRNA synthetase